LKKQQNNLTEVEILRQKAKELLKNKSPKTTSINFEAKILKLFHELEVYQIELEMQNKELLQVKEQAEIEAQKYTELYVCSEDNQIKNLKILVVEDDETSHFLLTRTLQKISYEVLHAITGVEAVKACRNNPDLDLVMMDIRMPDMDGYEATRQIRQFNKDVIIIAQTAFGFSGDREKAIEAGCNDYISKPINKTLLFELIKKHLKN